MNRRRILFGLAVIALFAIPMGVAVYFWRIQDVERENVVRQNDIDSSLENNQQASQEAQQEEPAIPDFNAQALQGVLDRWRDDLATGAQASVVMMSTDGTEIATLSPDDKFFSASIYKLFVAYVGYQQIDSNETKPEDTYAQGFTRSECLDLMIRESHSPCAEEMWSEIGKEVLTAQFRSYGLENTDLVTLRTTARDVGKLLNRLANKENLSSGSQALFLDSMKTQDKKYRLGLPSGFSEEITVYNKVGWNEQQEYHDASIVELKDGRKLVVAVLTSGVGTANLRNLAKAIEEVL